MIAKWKVASRVPGLQPSRFAVGLLAYAIALSQLLVYGHPSKPLSDVVPTLEDLLEP